MRFPKIPWMNRTFDLFTRLRLDADGLVIPYYLSIPQNVNLFNSITLTNQQLDENTTPDPFKTGLQGLFNSSDAMTDAQIGGFKNALKDDFAKGWEELMKYDGYSTRGYMTLVGSDGRKFTNEVRPCFETSDDAFNDL